MQWVSGVTQGRASPRPAPADPATARRRLRLVIDAVDPLSRAGIAHYVSSRSDVQVLSSDRTDAADVMVVVVPDLNGAQMHRLRVLDNVSGRPLILVVDRLSSVHLLSAVEIGVVAVLWRTEMTAERFNQALLAVAAGQCLFPPEVQTGIVTDLTDVQRDVLAPAGLASSGLHQREIDVLRLMAEGLDIAEIARRIMYSERTVKGILHDVMTRLHLRNRSQAVAYAMRAGHF